MLLQRPTSNMQTRANREYSKRADAFYVWYWLRLAAESRCMHDLNIECRVVTTFLPRTFFVGKNYLHLVCDMLLQRPTSNMQTRANREYSKRADAFYVWYWLRLAAESRCMHSANMIAA